VGSAEARSAPQCVARVHPPGPATWLLQGEAIFLKLMSSKMGLALLRKLGGWQGSELTDPDAGAPAVLGHLLYMRPATAVLPPPRCQLRFAKLPQVLMYAGFATEAAVLAPPAPTLLAAARAPARLATLPARVAPAQVHGHAGRGCTLGS
jgi:hypothetical protein